MRGAALLELVVATGLMLVIVAALGTTTITAMRTEARLREAIEDARRVIREMERRAKDSLAADPIAK